MIEKHRKETGKNSFDMWAQIRQENSEFHLLIMYRDVMMKHKLFVEYQKSQPCNEFLWNFFFFQMQLLIIEKYLKYVFCDRFPCDMCLV